jgi:branched-chain amino acid transport system permease protein
MINRKSVQFTLSGVFIVFVFFIPLIITSSYWMYILILGGISIILASSLRLINITGQLSLAHGGMMTLGAYTSTLMVIKLGLSSWIALLAGGISAGLMALLVGFPFMRLKGIYFSMVTLFLASVISLTIEQWKTLTNGTMGIVNIPIPDPIGIPGSFNIDFSSPIHFYYLMLVVLLVTLLILYAFEHSRVGSAFSSISQADFLSESVGIDTTRYKVIAFSVGCFFAGVAGALYSQYVRTISPNSFSFIYTIYIVVYMVVGGSGKFIGPIIGALLLTIVPEQFRWLGKYQPLLFAAVLMLVIFFIPQGLVGLPSRLQDFINKRKKHAGYKEGNKAL